MKQTYCVSNIKSDIYDARLYMILDIALKIIGCVISSNLLSAIIIRASIDSCWTALSIEAHNLNWLQNIGGSSISWHIHPI